MNKYVIKSMNMEKLKQLIIWNRESNRVIVDQMVFLTKQMSYNFWKTAPILYCQK